MASETKFRPEYSRSMTIRAKIHLGYWSLLPISMASETKNILDLYLH